MITVITIRYKDIDLTKATTQGLEFMLECLVCQEWYEAAAEVRDELFNRKKTNNHE